MVSGGADSSDKNAIQNQIGSFTQTINSAIDITKLTTNYGYYIQMLNAQKEKQAMLPDNVTMGGSNATLLGYELLDDDIFTQYNIKSQFARRIDSYFDVYGYQTNEFKVPNTWNRKYWNYVKTQGANFEPTTYTATPNAPQEAIQVLKAIYDSGVTLWHDPDHFLDYTQDNRASMT